MIRNLVMICPYCWGRLYGKEFHCCKQMKKFETEINKTIDIEDLRKALTRLSVHHQNTAPISLAAILTKKGTCCEYQQAIIDILKLLENSKEVKDEKSKPIITFDEKIQLVVDEMYALLDSKDSIWVKRELLRQAVNKRFPYVCCCAKCSRETKEKVNQSENISKEVKHK